MTPMPRPPMSYVSRGPFVLTHEWRDGEIQSLQCVMLKTAIQMFWCEHPPLHREGYAERSVVFDVRGIIVLGCNQSGLSKESWVATREVIRTIESLELNDAGMAELIELELSCLMEEMS